MLYSFSSVTGNSVQNIMRTQNSQHLSTLFSVT